ncbi:Pre-mRNA-splicing factor [Komagataella phaffii CBS 7435]|uniref:Zinc cluster protein involved in pre-mRNA splicing and cycloheximide resistance n=3 Tax=Komagataella TaxID=460517 RepID=C4R4Z3_KOMPG|nr:Zinc cluster protein involved in pre-mRNA splicing and cycloheximide resistance [Komagataella phaffii GS115]ANZ73602.1 BA75_00618T0 [Komagataella pastoris]AOA64189.1 GQ67_03656T0 [Komagataella phaffii]CAH2449604.1 Pre-mRNA-splicing factor [Komagataella phaffii CBS 7435]AOA69146.1 GQ68_03628T0 [Komagataella phaffii GS115]CAY70629.1 Zinc cluster protein involved in pre-mRNA splicing and cycloheximide resistance [Komagataella phaffii GS115]
MSRHQYDLVQCFKQPGTTIARLCDKCDGRCPSCDSYVNQAELAYICDECSFVSNKGEGKCILCGSKSTTDAYYCSECVMTEKDRDGCPRILNIGTTRSDLFYEKRKKN